MKKNKDLIFLKHIYDACSQISKYIKNITLEKFEKNRMLQDAVMRELGVIGEATKNLSDQIRNKYSNIPWKLIAGMRDKLIHGYFSVDIIEVWNTAKFDIIELKNNLKEILNNL